MAGQSVDLTRIEERLFASLYASANQVVTLEVLRQLVWPNQVVMPNTVHKHVSSLRGKLLDAGWTIENVRGSGYRLREQAGRAGNGAIS